MRIIKKVLFFIILFTGLMVAAFFDYADRNIIYSKFTSEEERIEFTFHKGVEDIKQAYERNYDNPTYLFPRGDVNKVLIFKNIPFVSRLTGRMINKSEILDFIRNPENFDWSETTWSIDEAEYILRFYDIENKEIGKMWICLNDCGMTATLPFAPTIKFGGLSRTGKDRISKILKQSSLK
jgi:hypothetical protein